MDLELGAELRAEVGESFQVFLELRRFAVPAAQHDLVIDQIDQVFGAVVQLGMPAEVQFHPRPVALVPALALIVEQGIDHAGRHQARSARGVHR